MRRYKEVLRFVSMCMIDFIIGIFIGFIRLHMNLDKSDYESNMHLEFDICQGYSFISGGYNDTSIKVVINEKEYDIDTMFEEVRDFHNRLNGEPDKLDIHLYNSRNDLKLGNCVGSKTYYKK